MVMVVSPYDTGGVGDPAAIKALPFVHSTISAGVASDKLVGFDSGKMTGCFWYAAMASTTSSVNAPVTPEAPISTVGFMVFTTSSSRMASLPGVNPSASANATGQTNSSLNASAYLTIFNKTQWFAVW
jgi:hypothetical protein